MYQEDLQGLMTEGDIESIEPPDNTGADVFARYRYQALVAFPYCLAMLTGNDVQCVIPEHFEDVAVNRTTGWTLLQIKTRDAPIGPWRLSNVLAADGGL